MPDDENVGVIEEVASPETVDQQTNIEPEPQEVSQEAETAQPEVPKKSKEDNLRQLGRAYEEEKRRSAELQAALLRMMPAQKAPEAAPEPVDELAGLDKEDFISVGQVEKIVERAVKKSVHSAMSAGRVERLEESFKGSHSDYDDVVNQDNFEKLFNDMPELKPVLAEAYESAVKGENIDPVSLSYKLLKQYKNSGEDMTKKATSDDRLNRNQAKPISANAIKSSALTEAHKYMGGAAPSKDDRARIYKETVEAAKARR
jgi:hypothetical protein